MKNIFWTLLIVTSIAFFTGCDNINSSNNDDEKQSVNIEDIEIQDDFNFSTIATTEVLLTVLNIEDNPVENVHFFICEDEIAAQNPLENNITHGFTNENGVFNTFINLPTYYNSLTIVGYMNTITIDIGENNTVEFLFGGSDETRGSETITNPRAGFFSYPYPYKNTGVPFNKYNTAVAPSFLQKLSEVFQEAQPLETRYPHLFEDLAEPNLVIEQECDISLVFVSERADYRNCLGYFEFPSDNKPQSVEEIADHNIMFANCSMNHSGGKMKTGYTLDLGTFYPGNTLGFFLVANGWVSSGGGYVSENKPIYYSINSLNPETANDKKQHQVLVHDLGEDVFALAFEDINRESGSDHDFNDLVCYLIVNPSSAVGGNVPNFDGPASPDPDRDNDGVLNEFDDYPDDPERAFNNFYPGENEKATLAYEDQWPSKGDFDFNDIVIDYNFLNIHDPDNKLMEIHASFTLKAIGAKYHNGFSFEVPFGMTLVDTAKINADYVSIDGNIVTVFDDAFHLIQPTQNFVNTINAESPISPVDISFWLKLDTHYEYVAGDYLPPYNPFITANIGLNDVTYEIHLCDYPPTIRADETVFGTMDDDSDLSTGRTYRTATNLPWAVHLSSEWKYPSENSVITNAYHYFDEWAGSGGVEHPDWYLYNDDNVNDDYLYLAQ